MQRRVSASVLGSLALTATAFGQSSLDGEEGIVLSHSVRAAFYEVAPRSIADSMLQATREECSAHREQTPSWLCDGRTLRFLRGVNVLGDRLETGFVCDAEGITPNLKFYTEDMFQDNSECVPICYDMTSSRHFFEARENDSAT